VIQQKVRNVLRRIAKRVGRNHLFEQPGERPVQPPIFHDAMSKRVQPMKATDIEERLLSARVVNHWATWCAPCVEELDILASIQSHIGEDKMLGINWDLFQGGELSEALNEITTAATGEGIKYDHCVVTDDPETFFSHFDLEEQIVPQTFVYSPTFEVLFHRVGVLTEEDIAKIVELVQGE
jgi:hypothetical protein